MPRTPNDKKLNRKLSKRLKNMVKRALKSEAKIEIVASGKERAELKRLKAKISSDDSYNDKMKCKVDDELSPNLRLQIKYGKRGNSKYLIFELYSLESSCLTESASVKVRRNNLETAVSKASRKLIKKLIGDINLPTEDNKTGKIVPSVLNPEDKNACDYARRNKSKAVWEMYLKKFPKGACAFEAEIEIGKLGDGEDKGSSGGRTQDSPVRGEEKEPENDDMVNIPAGKGLSAFKMDKYEVTVADFRKCVNAGKCSTSNFKTSSDGSYNNYGNSARDNHPMNGVN